MMRKTRLGWRIFVVVVVSIGMQMSYAANNTAVVVTGCSLSPIPAATMVFSTNLLVGLQSTTSFLLNCNVSGNTGNAKITIDLSAGNSGSVSQRNQIQGTTANVLTYNLYKDSSYLNLWGNTNATQYSQTVSANIVNQMFTIYGRIDSSSANQSQPVGTYSDPIITASVNW